MEFQHFLFSRFNVQYLEMVPDKLGLDPNIWLENRIQLFFDFCYPSVQNQSNKNFKWIIYFDSRTPKKYLDYFSENDISGIIIFRFTDHWKKLDGDIREFLEKNRGSSEFLVSTRIDGDDAISEHFIETIQKEVEILDFKQILAINPLNGIILDSKSGIYYSKKMLSNPFISLIQRYSEVEFSIFGIEHQNISMNIKTKNIEKEKMWLQVVHGGNLINKPSGFPYISRQNLVFHINEKSLNRPGLKILGLAYMKYVSVRFNNLRVKIKRFTNK